MKKQQRKVKARYVDGFVLPVPKNKIAEYKKMAGMMAKLCKKYGVLDYKECVGEDMRPKGMGGMKFLHFPQMAKAKKGETVVFSYIVYKSRKHRDEVNEKIMKDPVMNDPKMREMPMPFDMKRMAYAGFKVIVDA
jgi:alkaline phosphatase